MEKLFFEKTLKEQGGKIVSLKSGFDALDVPIVITDVDANILYANRALEHLTGYTLKEVIGKNPGRLWGGQMPQEYYENMWRTIKLQKKPFAGTVRNRRKDGATYWQDMYISPILDEHGHVNFFLGVAPDIRDSRERKRFHDEFIAIITDQLQNPLTTIEWISDWLSKYGEVTKEQERGLAELFDQTQGLFDLIRDLFVIARIDKNSAPKKEKLDMGAELAKIVGEVKKRYPAFAITFEGDKEDAVIQSSKTLFAEAVRNIVWNAVEYSDKSTGNVAITLAKTEQEYILTCKDNGIGIPEQEQEKVFRTFYRGSNAKQMKGFGTGLGLFIVKLIADYLRWGLAFESRVGEGVTFSLLIPRGASEEKHTKH